MNRVGGNRVSSEAIPQSRYRLSGTSRTALPDDIPRTPSPKYSLCRIQFFARPSDYGYWHRLTFASTLQVGKLQRLRRQLPSPPSRLVLIVAIVCLLAGPALAQKTSRKTPPTSEPPQVQPVPVVVDGKTLFDLYALASSVTLQDRAAAISKHIVDVSEHPRTEIQSSIHVVDEDGLSFIMFGDMLIMTITDHEARLAGRPREALADEYSAIIREAALARNAEYSKAALRMGLWRAGGATLLFIAVLWGIRVASRKLRGKLDRIQKTDAHVIRLQKAKLISAERLRSITVALLRIAEVTAILISLYLYVGFLLASFPHTRAYAVLLWSAVKSPLLVLQRELVLYLPNVFPIVGIIGFIYGLTKIAKFIFNHVGLGHIVIPGFYAEWASPTYKLTKGLLTAFALIAIFPYLPGSRSYAFQGIGIFVGALLSLGSTSVVANVVSGFVLTYTRAFKIGDRVRIGEAFGDIVAKTTFVTRVRTPKNVEIAIPNALVLTTQVLNYSAMAEDRKLTLHTEVTIGYDAPWRQVEALLVLAAQRTPNVLREPAPYILQTGLSDFYVKYELNVYVAVPQQMPTIYANLHRNIQDAFNEYGVQIMSPHYMTDRATPTFVPKEKWFEPPAAVPSASNNG